MSKAQQAENSADKTWKFQPAFALLSVGFAAALEPSIEHHRALSAWKESSSTASCKASTWQHPGLTRAFLSPTLTSGKLGFCLCLKIEKLNTSNSCIGQCINYLDRNPGTLTCQPHSYEQKYKGLIKAPCTHTKKKCYYIRYIVNALLIWISFPFQSDRSDRPAGRVRSRP